MKDLLSFPRVPLAHVPTRLEELCALGSELGVRTFVKRDDCTGLAFGGNKTRKLEFVLGDALTGGTDSILTCGGIQSNHVRQTAAAAAQLGLPCEAVVANPLSDPGPAYERSGNVLLDELFGAKLHRVDTDDEVEVRLQQLYAEKALAGGRPYLVPLGASNAIGALGYVACAQELLEQCRLQDLAPSHVFVATGSAGTHGGLLAGLRCAGSNLRVVGVAVSETAEAKRVKVRSLVEQVCSVLEAQATVTDDDIVVRDDWVGPGYGVVTEASEAAIRRLARSEGLLLDPVYTGKAMAGMLALLESRELSEVRDPIFLHTGGAPALFAYL
ncbi:MAG: D-cysteine desulfhydrase family protein [bacterium]|nr:D-cysteine desulfhydrase family protein [bacterium]